MEASNTMIGSLGGWIDLIKRVAIWVLLAGAVGYLFGAASTVGDDCKPIAPYTG